MDNECDFKYGEILEFSNKEDFEDPYTGKFLAYHPKEQDGECYVDFETDVWRYARRPLLNLKDGDPVVVGVNGLPTVRIFSHFDGAGNIEVYRDGHFKNLYAGDTITHSTYRLLENYNYDAD